MLYQRIRTERTMPAKRNAKMEQHRRSSMAVWSFVAGCYGVLLLLIAGHFKPDLDVQLTVYKVGHAVAFAGLGLLIAYYFKREFEFSIVLGVALTLLACTFFGALIELYQCLLPGRSPELRDIALDSMGALVGALTYAAHRMAGPIRPRATGRHCDAARTARGIHCAKPGQIIAFPLRLRYVPLRNKTYGFIPWRHDARGASNRVHHIAARG